jgi:hypothetical protein
MKTLSTWRRRLFGIPPGETSFERRGFGPASDAARRALEGAGEAFVSGYHTALSDDHALTLGPRLEATIELARVGFAYEGAAMALCLLDRLTPWQGVRVDRFLRERGAAHIYMVHVGAGWALARLRRKPTAALPWADPVLRWLIVDGYGFHQGYFHPRRFIEARERLPDSSPYTQRAFDQGLGRSLWFAHGAGPDAVAARIATFADERQADLWSGVGLAAAYAGGVDRPALERLLGLGAAFRSELALGACFAAKARIRAENLVSHTEAACAVFVGRTAEEAASLTDVALEAIGTVPATGGEPAYEQWRRGVVRLLDRVAIA